MATERAVLILNQLAGEDFSPTATSVLTGNNGAVACGQYLFVKRTPAHTVDTVVHCSNHKDRPLGVSQDDTKTGDGMGVMVLGVSKITLGETLVAGQAAGTDAAGRAVHKSETATGADYGDFVMGEILQGGAAGELGTILLTGPYRE
jgi:hypothetical protein